MSIKQPIFFFLLRKTIDQDEKITVRIIANIVLYEIEIMPIRVFV